MPIFRYFVFVGGALLALLFAADFVWPVSPTAQSVATASYEQPLIRIRSDRHLPDRVVLDTSQPTIAAPTMKTAAVAAPQPPAQRDVSPVLKEMSAKAGLRETFAQAPKADAASVKTADAKPQHAPARRKIARAHLSPQRGQPMMLMAQQPHFGLFDMTW